MANKYAEGLLYKKVIDANGNVTGEVPFLTKTLSSLVIMKDGSTLDNKIGELESSSPVMNFDSYTAYESAYNNGEIPDGVVCMIKE